MTSGYKVSKVITDKEKPMINYETMDDPETFVPPHMRDGYKRYFEHGIEMGGFGMAIIKQDAEWARVKADSVNINHIDTQMAWVSQQTKETTDGKTPSRNI